MKKFISFILAVSLAAACLAFAAPAGASSLYMTGDFNGDGKVDALDCLLLRRACVGMISESELYGADINRDGSANALDVYLLRYGLVGIISLENDYPESFGWKGFTVDGESIDGYEIVVSSPDNDNMRFAAEELAKYAKEGDGSTLSVVSERSAGAHCFILSEDETGELGDDGFTINVKDGSVYIRAGAKRGCMYAVYTVLEDLWGYRFYTYDDYELSYGKTTDIKSGTELREVPSFDCRSNCINSYADKYLYSTVIKRKLNGCTDQPSMQNPKYGWGICRTFANAHSFDVFIPKDEIGNTTARCLSNSDTFNVCLKNMKKLISDRLASGEEIGKSITQISCSYASDEVYCQCRLCGKVLRQEKSYSGILARFVNKIDDALHEDYPEITVVTNAYASVRKPPEKTALNDDIVLLYCWNGCTSHAIGSGECSEKEKINFNDSLMGSNKIDEAYFAGWAEKCKNIYIWYYPTNIYYLLCPQPNYFKLYDDFKWFSDNGAKGFYVVGTVGSSFEDLDAYLISELMWNADMSRDEYEQKAKEFLRYYYGYGWIYIWQYMDMLTEAGVDGCVLNDYDQPFDIYKKSDFAEKFDEMQALFKSASSLARTERERENILRLSAHMLFLGYSATYERDCINGSAEQKAAFEKGWREVYDYINENNIPVNYSENGISKAFDISVSPMELVYGISGSR